MLLLDKGLQFVTPEGALPLCAPAHGTAASMMELRLLWARRIRWIASTFEAAFVFREKPGDGTRVEHL